jgi:hypothetical protein
LVGVEGRVSSPAWGIESGRLSVAEQQAVAVVTLRRPEKLNAPTASMRRELATIVRHFGRGDAARPVPQPARSGR